MRWNLIVLARMNEAKRNGDWNLYFYWKNMFE